MPEQLLVVDDLRVTFKSGPAAIQAVNGASFEVAEGETLGIVGESGCGKSATALALLGLLPRGAQVTSGRAEYAGQDLLTLSERQLRRIRGRHVAMVFQDPMTSLNPVLTIGRQLTETLKAHFDLTDRQAHARARELLVQVGMGGGATRLSDYPHQFSGGMRQRAMIAMALACEPEILIADEPTTALDVTIQAQILDLLRALVVEHGTALVLITHDLGVVAGMCERVQVMYAGTFVEAGLAETIFENPRHPYTLGLLESLPRVDARRGQRLRPIGGHPPVIRSFPSACPFAPRCGRRVSRCESELPELEARAGLQPVACWNPVPAGTRFREALDEAT